MKKILLLTLCIMALITNTVMAGAAEDILARKNSVVGVVIIGGSDFKTPDYYDYIHDTFSQDDEQIIKMYRISAGNELQSKYLDYWIDQGFLEEQTPKKNDLLNFVTYGQYDKVIFLMVKDPVTEKHSRQAGIFGTVTQARTSVQINAFLCDNTQIIKTYTAIKEDDSEWSDLRAKRGAFEKCIKDIAKEIKPLLKK